MPITPEDDLPSAGGKTFLTTPHKYCWGLHQTGRDTKNIVMMVLEEKLRIGLPGQIEVTKKTKHGHCPILWKKQKRNKQNLNETKQFQQKQ